MMLLWQKRAMVNVVNDALQCVHASARTQADVDTPELR